MLLKEKETFVVYLQKQQEETKNKMQVEVNISGCATLMLYPIPLSV